MAAVLGPGVSTRSPALPFMPCWSEPTLEPPCGHASEASIREPTAQMGHASPRATHIQQHADAEGTRPMPSRCPVLARDAPTRRLDGVSKGGAVGSARLAPDDSRRIKATYVFGATNCLFDQGLVLGGREGARGRRRSRNGAAPASGGRPRAAARDRGATSRERVAFRRCPAFFGSFAELQPAGPVT